MDNRRRYQNVIEKMNLQDEDSINVALKKKGFYSSSKTFPLSSLHFELTSRCNAFCKHCYNNSGLNNKDSDAMTPDKWVSFSKYLVEHGGVFECLLSGGEPLLLGDKLFEIMDILNDDGTIFLVMTNGYLLSEEMSKKLKKYRYHWLQVSIDGATAEYHDSFRQAIGSWDRAIRGAAAASNYGIPIKIAHCVTPYNLNDVDDMCAIAYSLGASSIMAGGISLSGRVGENMDLLLSDTERKILCDKLEENRIRYQGRMRVKATNSVRNGLENHAKRPRSGAVIRPNGDIKIDGMAPFVIGNILSDDFAEAWENKIDVCWDNPKVKEFISGFDKSDRNKNFINYVENDIHI